MPSRTRCCVLGGTGEVRGSSRAPPVALPDRDQRLHRYAEGAGRGAHCRWTSRRSRPANCVAVIPDRTRRFPYAECCRRGRPGTGTPKVERRARYGMLERRRERAHTGAPGDAVQLPLTDRRNRAAGHEAVVVRGEPARTAESFDNSDDECVVRAAWPSPSARSITARRHLELLCAAAVSVGRRRSFARAHR
jgi:hypothetical protein